MSYLYQKMKKSVDKKARLSEKQALAALMALSIGLTILPAGGAGLISQASPRFARTNEEWARLEDNVLEYGEIADLVKEYNATVLQNEEDFADDERRLMDAQDVREMMIRQADDYDQMAVDMESTSQASAAQYRSQANTLRDQADDNVTDKYVLRWNYDRMEAEIAQSARTYFFDYYSSLEEQKKAHTAYGSAKLSYDSTVNRYNVGLATDIDVMTAQEGLTSAEAAILTADVAVDNARRLLQVSCGWRYDSQPKIGPLPEMELSEIAAIDLGADTDKAIANSFALKIDQRMLENTISSNNYVSLRNKYQDQIEDDRDQIRNSVKTAYEQLTSAKTAYDNAVNARSLAENTAATSERSLSLGQISNTEYQTALKSLETARYDEEIARIAVMSAWSSYDTAIAGLASAGTSN